jgi:hypothetical protein
VSGDPVYWPKIRIRSTDGEGQPSWGFSGKNLGLFLLLLLLGSLIVSFYLNQASHMATAGLEVVHLIEQRERWRQDNADLRKQVAEMQSLSNIRRRAELLGFVEREGIEHLFIASPALEPLYQGRPDSIPVEDKDTVEPRPMSSGLARWWEELIARFDSWMNIQP